MNRSTKLRRERKKERAARAKGRTHYYDFETAALLPRQTQPPAPVKPAASDAVPVDSRLLIQYMGIGRPSCLRPYRKGVSLKEGWQSYWVPTERLAELQQELELAGIPSSTGMPITFVPTSTRDGDY